MKATENLRSLYDYELKTKIGGQGRNRTTDTRIFSPLLYRLSYLGIVLYNFDCIYGVEDCAAAMVLGWYFVST